MTVVLDRNDKSYDALEVDQADQSWFRFWSRAVDAPRDRLEVRATGIDRKIADGLLAFPDVALLPAGVHLVDVAPADVQGMLSENGLARVWIAKMCLSCGPEMREKGDRAMADADWDVLKKRDQEFGKIYRAALADQHVSFIWKEATSTTQKSR